MIISYASCQIRKIASAHAPGMPGTFPPPLQVSDPDMHHGTCVTHVPWCMPGSLNSGFLWSRRVGETFPAFQKEYMERHICYAWGNLERYLFRPVISVKSVWRFSEFYVKYEWLRFAVSIDWYADLQQHGNKLHQVCPLLLHKYDHR